MNQKLYFFGNFFLGLTVAAGVCQSILRFRLGPQIFTLQSFAGWFLVANIISLLGTCFVLKYYHHKKYRFTLAAGALATLASLGLFVITYTMLMGRALESYYMPALLLTLGTGIVYAISLIVSPAGKSPWLKSAGVLMLIIGLVLGSALIWSMNDPEVQTSGALEKTAQWTSLAGSLLPLLFMMQFFAELRWLKAEEGYTPRPRFSESFLGLVGVLAIGFMLFFGLKVAEESAYLVLWMNRGPERAQRLAKPFEARTYVSSEGDTMRYRLMKPLDYDPTRRYPLVVCLHGGGGSGTDNAKQIEGSWAAQLLMKQQNREAYPAFLFVPQCPPGSGWGGIPSHPGVDALVFETMRALEQEYEIDTTRRYVMGESLGGYGAWHFIGTRPKLFAAAVPVCGGGDPGLAQNMVDVSVWAFHGEKDRSVPVRFSRDMIEAIKEAGGNPRYSEFQGEGHIISEQLFTTPDLLGWLFAQQRE